MANKDIKKILIATGIYPPDIGGPAQYAFELEREWRSKGYKVCVKYFYFEKKLPTGLRHLFYLLKSIPAIVSSDFILVLDTWSAAFPIAIGCKIFGKKFTIRTGGDFLWESYVERTKEKILFKDFYSIHRECTRKEKFIYKTTKWILRQASKIIFSTDWQRQIWIKAYNLSENKTKIIENFYGNKILSGEPKGRVFLGATRNLVWKNLGMVKDVFALSEIKAKEFSLDLSPSNHERFIERMQDFYAVILVSLGDISPNMILDAIRCGKPFICTREVGIYERIKGVGVFVDPLNKEDIKEKILWLCEGENYAVQKEKLSRFSFTHSWAEIAQEILNI